MTPTAILIDGAFFLHRYRRIFGRAHSPARIAKTLRRMCVAHLDDRADLYRIFFYDCPPLTKKAHNPISGEAVDFSRTREFAFRTEFHRELVKQRKVALRLGRLSERGSWALTPRATRDLLRGAIDVDELRPEQAAFQMVQKGVDMRIGLDIASLAYKRLVKRIVLVTGDADFVPAAKHARREGVDVILDPMWQHTSDDLLEHIDGLSSRCPRSVVE